jgi:ABC-type Fe3+-hydroxamate transport system substrate-binding protein
LLAAVPIDRVAFCDDRRAPLARAQAAVIEASRTWRVVSLVPSLTETLIAWGVEPIACTRFCEQPSLPHVGGTKDPSILAIVALEPDLVVLDKEENRLEDYEALVAEGLDVHALSVRSIRDLDRELGALASRLGVNWQSLDIPAPLPVTASAFVPIWRRPWIALGEPTYASSVLALFGIISVFAAEGPYPRVSLEEASARRPSVVLAPSEPYPFTERQLPELQTVGAVRFLDGKDLFWWGARTAGAIRRLELALAGIPRTEPEHNRQQRL